jgi:signal transduction histidine kinase
VDVPDDLGQAHIDVAKIRDSLNHLLLNAIKFTPDGGRIDVAARRANDGFDITVADSGVGIDESHLRQLFQPFFTGFDVSHHSSGHFEYGTQGIGLGLSVVKAFVEMHGGSVDAKSQLGKGSTFTIHLPETRT